MPRSVVCEVTGEVAYDAETKRLSMVIEYFNMMLFDEGFAMTTTPVAGGVVGRLSCGLGMQAPKGFDLQLSTVDHSARSACNDAAGLTRGAESCANGSECVVVVTLRNSDNADKVFSQTEIRLLMRAATMNPEPNPAALPMCLSTITPCSLEGSC